MKPRRLLRARRVERPPVRARRGVRVRPGGRPWARVRLRGRPGARRRLRALYGAGPLNFLVLVASFAIAGAAVAGWFQRPRDVVTVLEWFAAAIVLHDLVALPLYSLLDRLAHGSMRVAGRSAPALVDPTPYLRIPAILSGLLLLVFFPVLFGLGSAAERSASGIPEGGYLARWLLATGVIFAVAATAYAVAVARAPRRPAAEPD